MHRSRASLTVVIAAASLLASAGCSRSARLNHHLRAARGYFDAAHYDRAEIEYLDVLQLDPRNADAIGGLAQVYFKEGRLGRLMPYLLTARRLQPENLGVRIDLAQMYVSLHQPKAAVEEAEYVLSRRPADARAPLILAQAAAGLGADGIASIRRRLAALPEPARDSSAALTALGCLDLEQRRFASARALLIRAAAADPTNPTAVAGMAAWYLAQRDVPHARQAMDAASRLAPSDPSLQLQCAQMDALAQDRTAARGRLLRLTAGDPDYLPAWMQLAELDATDRKYAAAESEVERVLARDPSHPEALILDARLKVQTGKGDEAITVLEQAVALYPHSAAVLTQLGAAYVATKKLDKAVEALRRAVALAPGDTESVLMLAGLEIRRGDAASTLGPLEQLLGAHPELVQGWLTLADAYVNLGDYDDAVRAYRKLAALRPRDPQAHWLTGLTFQKENRQAEARTEFEQALAAAPDFLPATEQLVNLDLAEHRYAAALRRMQSCLATTSKPAVANVILAKVYLTMGDLTHAESALQRAVQLNPDAPVARLTLARIYAARRRYEPAVAQLGAILRSNPNDPDALLLLAMIGEARGDAAGARDNYERLIAVAPFSAVALNNLACLYADRLGKLDRAYEVAQRARIAGPHDPHIADTLGWILWRKGQFRLSLSLIREAAANLPDDPTIEDHLGCASYMCGDEAAAAAALRRAVAFKGSLAGREEAESDLAVLAIDPRHVTESDRRRLDRAIQARADDPVALRRLSALDEQEGSPGRAIAAWSRALQLSPESVPALMALADLRARQGEPTQALELAAQARNLAPDEAGPAKTLGWLKYQAGDSAVAFSLLQQAAQLLPADADTQYEFALASYAMGQNDQATAAMKSALAANPDFGSASQARNFLELMAIAANPPADAGARLADLIRSDADPLPALMTAAVIAERAASPRDAIAAYQRVLDRYPWFAPAKRRIAILDAENHLHSAQGFALGLQARALFPDDADLAKALGMLAYGQGDYAQAQEYLEESIGAGTGDPEARRYLALARKGASGSARSSGLQ